MGKKQIEGGSRDNRLDDDLAGAEAVELRAAVEQHLQSADREAHRAEAEPVQFLTGVLPGLWQKSGHAEEGKDADRKVDVKHIAPAIGLSQPAAEYRSKNGAGHYRHAPERHGRALPFLRIDVEQHGLRERYERRAQQA